jgi:hypothetical protein
MQGECLAMRLAGIDAEAKSPDAGRFLGRRVTKNRSD